MPNYVNTQYPPTTQPSSYNTYMYICPHAGLHKLPNGVKTKFFEALENGKNYVMPTNAEEFQEMMELVLYNPKTYTFHQRMREALVKIQMPNYEFFQESKYAILSNITIYSHFRMVLKCHIMHV